MLVHGTYAYVQHFCHFLIFTAFKMALFKNHTGLRTKTVHHLIYNLQLLFMGIHIPTYHVFTFFNHFLLVFHLYLFVTQIVNAQIMHRPVKVGFNPLIAQALITPPGITKQFADYIFCYFLIFHPVQRIIKELGVILLEQLLKFFLPDCVCRH